MPFWAQRSGIPNRQSPECHPELPRIVTNLYISLFPGQRRIALSPRYDDFKPNRRIMEINCIPIIGTSNSGKSPLGRLIESESARHGPRVVHLDFGECLRKAAVSPEEFALSAVEHRYVQSVLDGTLFDDAHFSTAVHIINGYMKQRSFHEKTDILLLNGIPRHVGQARSLDAEGFRVGTIIQLDCDIPTAMKRYELSRIGNGHENRSDRNDNNRETIRRKLESYLHDTQPVLDWYRKHDIPMHSIPIHETTTPRAAYDHIADKIWTNLKPLNPTREADQDSSS